MDWLAQWGQAANLGNVAVLCSVTRFGSSGRGVVTAHRTNFVEMLFRGLYHFNYAYNQGKATDLASYFAARENHDLGVVKALPKAKQQQRLDLSPHPT